LGETEGGGEKRLVQVQDTEYRKWVGRKGSFHVKRKNMKEVFLNKSPQGGKELADFQRRTSIDRVTMILTAAKRGKKSLGSRPAVKSGKCQPHEKEGRNLPPGGKKRMGVGRDLRKGGAFSDSCGGQREKSPAL